MNRFFDWLDHRTGYRGLIRAALYEHIPGGARWRYVWGSTLAFVFFVQMITGVVLWMAYSPSAQTAWESVFYIQHQMWGGWLVRGIHHYAAQAMIVLLVLHLIQVVIDGAYRAPREINFWIGLILLQLVLLMGLTGYLLPWDQKGYWATRVATNLMENVPLIGHSLQQLAVGGPEYGHHTLTRFFALHAGVIPGLMVLFIVLHLAMFRRHGLTAKKPLKKPDASFWPDQVLRDGLACALVLAVIIVLAVVLGAPLSAPAEPSRTFKAARPEWYFLFLFQLLKLVPVFLGAIVIPGIIAAVLALMPITGRSQAGHRFNIAALALVLAGAAGLTVMAFVQDRGDQEHLDSVADAEKNAQRVVELAESPTGIPMRGARYLLLEDPLTQGPQLFARHCAACHRYNGHNGLGVTPKDPPTASDLYGYHTKKWLLGLLDPKKIDTAAYFANTPFAKTSRDAGMIDYVNSIKDNYVDEDYPKLTKLIANLTQIAQMDDPPRTQPQLDEYVKRGQADEKRAKQVKANEALFKQTKELIEDAGLSCSDCHKFLGEGGTAGPNLSGYRSRQWMIDLITDPKHVGYRPKSSASKEKQAEYFRRYNMPAFGTTQSLDPESIKLLVDWLRGNYYQPPPGRDGKE